MSSLSVQQHTHIVLHTANTNLYIQQWMSIAYYYGDILLPSACCTYTYNYAYCCLGSVICMILAAECCSILWWLLCVAYTGIHVSLRTCGYEQYVCVVVCVCCSSLHWTLESDVLSHFNCICSYLFILSCVALFSYLLCFSRLCQYCFRISH